VAEHPVFTITGRRVLNPTFQLEDRTFPRLVADCPNCSSSDTKPLSYTANTVPYSVYECRACAHVWRFIEAGTVVGAS
jgi:Zn ribbon nucleic-acid-binding protein